MSVQEIRNYTAQEIINLFSAIEKLGDAALVQQNFDTEIQKLAGLSTQEIALLRVDQITGREINSDQQEQLNQVGRFLLEALVAVVAKIPKDNYAEYVLKVFSIIQVFEGIHVVQALDNQMQENANTHWEKIALQRTEINEGKKLTTEQQNSLTTAGIYLSAILNTLLESFQ